MLIRHSKQKKEEEEEKDLFIIAWLNVSLETSDTVK